MSLHDDMTHIASAEEMAAPTDLRAEWQRRKRSTVRCVACGHIEANHGEQTRTCLTKHYDKTRCRCNRFVAPEPEAQQTGSDLWEMTEDEATETDLVPSLTASVVAAMSARIARLEKRLADLEGRERIA